MDSCAEIVLMGLALQLLPLALLACANCTVNNYGWVLYILSEFVPATVFYFAVLTLQIRITSAPMNSFIMFSQILVTLINEDSKIHVVLMEN